LYADRSVQREVKHDAPDAAAAPGAVPPGETEAVLRVSMDGKELAVHPFPPSRLPSVGSDAECIQMSFMLSASFPGSGSRPLTPPQPHPLRCTRRCPSGRRTRGSKCTPPFSRTNRTSLVPPLVLSGHAASLTSYRCTPRSWKRRGRTRPRAARCASSSRTRRWQPPPPSNCCPYPCPYCTLPLSLPLLTTGGARARGGGARALRDGVSRPPKRPRSVGQDQEACCCWTHAVGNRCHRTQNCALLRCTFPARTPPPHRRARGVAAADRRGPQRLAGDVRARLRALHGARARRLRPLARAGRRLRAEGE
jgi:hypothetical protein